MIRFGGAEFGECLFPSGGGFGERIGDAGEQAIDFDGFGWVVVGGGIFQVACELGLAGFERVDFPFGVFDFFLPGAAFTGDDLTCFGFGTAHGADFLHAHTGVGF